MAFAEALAQGISDNPGVSPYYAGKVQEVLNAPDSIRKRLAIRMLENHAEAQLKDDPNTPRDAAGAIDWSSVDWATVLTTLLKIFVAILPLLLV